MAYMKSRREFLKQAGLYSAISLPAAAQPFGYFGQGVKATPEKDVMIPQADAENRLYKKVSAIWDKSFKNKYINWLDESKKFEYKEAERFGKKIYFLGTYSTTRMPFDYAHEKIVPLIKKDPKDWLILSWKANQQLKDPEDNPIEYYFQELGKIFSIPEDDALADLTKKQNREKVRKGFLLKGKVFTDEIDQFLLLQNLTLFRKDNPDANAEELLNHSHQLEKLYRWPNNHALYLVREWNKTDERPFTDDEFKEVWDGVSEGEFKDKLKKYSDKGCVLVSVGYEHMHIFLGK